MTDEERIIQLNRRTQQLKSIVNSLLDEYPQACLHGRLKVWEEGVTMIIKYFAEHSGIEPLIRDDAVAVEAGGPGLEAVGFFVHSEVGWREVSDREATEEGSTACFLYREVPKRK